MVISRTKYDISREDIVRIFHHAGFGPVRDIRVLGAGEFNSVFAVEAGEETYVLKVAADNDAVQIYEKDMMKSEIHWYGVMAEHTDLRIPRIYFTDFTKQVVPTDYFIMEYIRGTPRDALSVTPEQRQEGERQVAQMLARLHRVKGEKFGYIQTGLYATWDQALQSMVENLLRDAAHVNQRLPQAEKILDLIDRYRQVLAKAPCRLISFDAWEGNFICVSQNRDRPEFVWIDPERCLWGDPMLDFVSMEAGIWCLREKTTVLEAYNKIAEFPVSATREEEIRYAFGLCYLGAIMDCEKYYRYTPDLPHWRGKVDLSEMFYDLGFSLLA